MPFLVLLLRFGKTTFPKNYMKLLKFLNKECWQNLALSQKQLTPLEKIIFQKAAAWLLAERHSTGQHIVAFHKIIFLGGVSCFCDKFTT